MQQPAHLFVFSHLQYYCIKAYYVNLYREYLSVMPYNNLFPTLAYRYNLSTRRYQ